MIAQLREELAAVRLGYANLIAAARATLGAAREGDSYALEFLADELAVEHGQDDLDHPALPIHRGDRGTVAHWWQVGR